MNNLVCKSKSAALSTLDTIVGNMGAGIQKTAIAAVRQWIEENVPSESGQEVREKLRKIFEGDDADRLGREWYEQGSKMVDGKPVPAEPGHGARVKCLWNSETKKWEPEGIPQKTEVINDN
jgi:hypothetical protein